MVVDWRDTMAVDKVVEVNIDSDKYQHRIDVSDFLLTGPSCRCS